LPNLTWLKRDGTADNAGQVYSRDTARVICDILSDRRARSGGFGFADMLSPPYPAIFKTGTSNQFQDIVALGATMRYTAGVWMGNFSGETVVGKTGSSLPAEIVRSTLDMLTELGAAPASFPLPEGYAKEPVCALSGMTPTDACPAVTSEFVPRGMKLLPCNWHYRSGERVLTQYPAEYQRWVSGKNTDIVLFGDTGNAESRLRFLYPADGAVFVYDPAIPLEAQQFSVDCIGGNENHAALFCNGIFIGESERPFSWTVPVMQAQMTLSVVCGDARAEIAVTMK
jgi:penicillin-binding protein 1C